MTLYIDKKTFLYTVCTAIVLTLLTSILVCKSCMKKETIGVLDLQRVVSVSRDVTQLRASRAAQIAELQKMADAANAEIDKIKKDEDKKVATEKYLAEIQTKKNEFDNAYNAALVASDNKIQGIIDSVAEKKNLSVVINKPSVITGGVDITEAVVDLVK